MTDKQQATIDAWIAIDPAVSCVVYMGGGCWYPARETHDGPQPISIAVGLTYSLTTYELVAWCEARLAEAACA